MNGYLHTDCMLRLCPVYLLYITFRASIMCSSCLLYKYLSLDKFPSSEGSDGICRMDNSLPRPCQTEQITPRHPPLIGCYGSDVSMAPPVLTCWLTLYTLAFITDLHIVFQIDVLFHLPVPHPGRYAIVVEYANEEELQTTNVAVISPQTPPQQGTFSFYPCKFRSVYLQDVEFLLVIVHDLTGTTCVTASCAVGWLWTPRRRWPFLISPLKSPFGSQQIRHSCTW